MFFIDIELAHMASRAVEFFRQLKSHPQPAQFIRKLVADQTPESDFLEFKAGRILEKDIKKYWSQALSGFANTEGGVLIFGVRTDRIDVGSGRPIDAAADIDLVPNPAPLAQLLKDNYLHATVDPVLGVEYLPIEDQPDGGGFAVCLVPEGSHKPYRAELDASKNYFQRAGDSFVIINHSLLRTLFYPRNAPQFEIELRVHFLNIMLRMVYATIRNVGTGTARETMAEITSDNPAVDRIQPHGAFGTAGAVRKCRAIALHAIHPNDVVDFFTATWRVEPENQGTAAETVSFRVKVFAADASAAHYSATLTGAEQKQNKVLLMLKETAGE